MNLNEIANEIRKREDTEIAKAFTMVVANLLLSKGIQPVINKSLAEYDNNDDLNKHIIRQEYNVTFDIDTTEHDKTIRKEEREKTIEECKQILKTCHMIRTMEDDFVSKVEVPFYRKLWKEFDELKGKEE